MNILFIGDIFSSVGRHIVADHLADIKETQHIDLAIANAENSAGGFGVTPSIAEELFALGLDVLTSGNHIWDKKEIYDYFARRPALLRPANYAAPAPGAGVIVAKARNGADCAVINLQGRTYMPATECPFRKADEILAVAREHESAVRGFSRGTDQRENGHGLVSGWPRLRDGGNPHAHSHRRHAHSAGRHRLSDRCRA